MNDRRTRVGAAGETFAASWLTRQGLAVVGSNLEVDGGELDIIVRDGSQIVAVEVRTIVGDRDPIDAVGTAKRARVRRLAARVGANRTDFLGLALGSEAVIVHWVPG